MERQRPSAVIAEDEAVLREELQSQIEVLWPDGSTSIHAGGPADCERVLTPPPAEEMP